MFSLKVTDSGIKFDPCVIREDQGYRYDSEQPNRKLVHYVTVKDAGVDFLGLPLGQFSKLLNALQKRHFGWLPLKFKQLGTQLVADCAYKMHVESTTKQKVSELRLNKNGYQFVLNPVKAKDRELHNGIQHYDASFHVSFNEKKMTFFMTISLDAQNNVYGNYADLYFVGEKGIEIVTGSTSARLQFT